MSIKNNLPAVLTKPEQTKSVTAGTSAVTVTPDSGYVMTSVTVNPTPSETKTVNVTTAAQNVTPSSGKLLSKVTINQATLDTTSVGTTLLGNVNPNYGQSATIAVPAGTNHIIVLVWYMKSNQVDDKYTITCTNSNVCKKIGKTDWGSAYANSTTWAKTSKAQVWWISMKHNQAGTITVKNTDTGNYITVMTYAFKLD